MTDEDVERLMQFEGIVKNRQKIKSTITNARQFLSIQKEFGSFYNYTLSFFPNQKPIINTFQSLSEIPASSPESEAMSKDMKKRGFKFFGATICYAHRGFGIYQRSSDGLRLPKKIIKRGCPKSRIAPFAIVYFGKSIILPLQKTNIIAMAKIVFKELTSTKMYFFRSAYRKRWLPIILFV